jgi:hypothetical protein
MTRLAWLSIVVLGWGSTAVAAAQGPEIPDEAPVEAETPAIEAEEVEAPIALSIDRTAHEEPAPLTLATCPAGLECHPDRAGVIHAFRRTETHRMQSGLIIAGSVMLGAAWAVNIVGSVFGSLALAVDTTSGTRAGDYLGWSFVPLVGPIAQMFQLGDEHWAITILALIEAVEVVGVVLAALGTVGEDVVVLEPVAGLRVLPWAGAEGGGALISGSF